MDYCVIEGKAMVCRQRKLPTEQTMSSANIHARRRSKQTSGKRSGLMEGLKAHELEPLNPFLGRPPKPAVLVHPEILPR